MRCSSLLLALCCAMPLPSADAARETPPMPVAGFGVCTHLGKWNDERLVPLARQLGVSMVRDEIYWQYVEHTKGVYKMPRDAERWLAELRQHGLKLVLVLSYGNRIYDNPLDPDAFAAYAAFLAKTLGPTGIIAAYEIWNEPMNFQFRKQYGGEWNGKDGSGWVAPFATLVQKTAAAIRAVDMKTPIITGGGTTPATYHLFNGHPKAFAQVDGLTDHPYTYKTEPEIIPFGGKGNLKRDGVSVADDEHSMVSLLDWLGRNGSTTIGHSQGVWVTEIGFPTHAKAKKDALTRTFTEEEQAAFHVRALAIGLSRKVKSWFAYDLYEDGTDRSDQEHFYGIVRRDFTPKPAYLALQRFAHLLGSTPRPAELARLTCAGATPRGVAGPQLVSFAVTGGNLGVAWMGGPISSATVPGTLALPPGVQTVTAINLVSGERIPLPERQSTVTIPVGPHPVAVTWR